MRAHKRLFRTMLGVVLILIIASPLVAKSEPRRCVDFDLQADNTGRVDRPQPVIVIKDESAVYETPEATVPVKSMRFNTRLKVKSIKKGSTRIQVSTEGGESPVGWIESNDLLCSFKAMKSQKTGLEQIFFVKVDVEEQSGERKTVKAFPQSNSLVCPPGGCRELGRLQKFFVFDHADGKYLLADSSSSLERGSLDLYGWVVEKDGFIWDTAYALRAREDLVFPAGHPMAGEPKTVPVYKNLEDARAGEHFSPIVGGPIWFKYEMRIPIIERIQDGNNE